MKINYKYKDKEFDDIRNIVYNSKLEINYDYIFEEYLPFQAFISKRTFFKDVTINPSIEFDPFEYVKFEEFNKDLFSKYIQEYLTRYEFDYSKEFANAVSGGIDSSIIALETKPKIIYSGFFKEKEFNEIPYSTEIAKKIKANHYKYELNELDFLRNMEECIEILCSPIGGLGSVAEYTTLKKILKDVPSIKQVIFGNGGDEIFMGYFFNYYIKEFYNKSCIKPKYMPNFLPFKKELSNKIIDFMIVASLNRGYPSALYSSFVKNTFISKINKIESIIDKLLFININITLPTLLHINNQICKSTKIKGFNPLANKDLIRISKYINTPISKIPKESLRTLYEDMPKKIKNNYIKRGFPIPTHKWDTFNNVVKNAYNSFFKRKEVTIEKMSYNGINRYTWGIFQAELCLRRFK